VQKMLLNTAAVVPSMFRGGFCCRIIFDVQKMFINTAAVVTY
jgi:hypothetical protein